MNAKTITVAILGGLIGAIAHGLIFGFDGDDAAMLLGFCIFPACYWLVDKVMK